MRVRIGSAAPVSAVSAVVFFVVPEGPIASGASVIIVPSVCIVKVFASGAQRPSTCVIGAPIAPEESVGVEIVLSTFSILASVADRKGPELVVPTEDTEAFDGVAGEAVVKGPSGAPVA